MNGCGDGVTRRPRRNRAGADTKSTRRVTSPVRREGRTRRKLAVSPRSRTKARPR